MKSLVFEGTLEVKDLDIPPIPKGHVLVKVEKFVVGPVEKSLAYGIIWVEPNRILGVEGFGKVVERGVEADLPVGSYVASPIDYGKLVGIEVNGMSAEFAVLPANENFIIEKEDEKRMALVASGAVAKRELEMAEGKTLIIGGGLVSLMVAKKGNLPVLPWFKRIREDVELFPTPASACSISWDTIIVNVIDVNAMDVALTCVKEGGKIITHPVVHYFVHPFSLKRVSVVKATPGKLNEGYEMLNYIDLEKYVVEGKVEEALKVEERVITSFQGDGGTR